MNRFQYNNAVKDLFELSGGFSLPEKMMRSYGYFDPASGKMPDTVHATAGRQPSQMIDRVWLEAFRGSGGTPDRQSRDHLSMSPIQMEAFSSEPVDHEQQRFHGKALRHLGRVFR